MQKLLYKAGPLGVMTVCVLWCCWSQLREATPLLAATEAKLPRIERNSLAPEISPPQERDPFQQFKPEPLPSQAEEAGAAELAEPEEPPFDPESLLPSIRLDATILGARRLAVVSGQIHNEGDRLIADAAPDVEVRLVQVLRDEIVVTIQEQAFRITYTHATPEASPQNKQPKGAKAPQASAKPAGEVPSGLPGPEDLIQAVAKALANLTAAADNEEDVNSADAAESEPSVEDQHKDCEFENDLALPLGFQELLNDE